jgi:hypothetical protein
MMRTMEDNLLHTYRYATLTKEKWMDEHHWAMMSNAYESIMQRNQPNG